MTKRNDPVKFTKKVKEFILQRMCEGHNVGDICRLWPDKVPFKDSIYRKTITDKSFRDDYNQAYCVYTMNCIDECRRVAILPATLVYPEVETWQQAEATLKRRMRSDEWFVDKVAGIFARRFDKAQKIDVAVEHTGTTQLAVINYYQDAPKLTIGESPTLVPQDVVPPSTRSRASVSTVTKDAPKLTINVSKQDE